MKRQFFKAIFSACLAFLFCSVLFAQANNRKNEYARIASQPIVLPTAKEALKVLFTNADIPMSSIKSCRSMKTAEDDRTILDYLTGVLAAQAEPNNKNSLKYAVKLIKGKNAVNYWEVELTFTSEDSASGDPWNNGFRFLIRTRDKRMVRGSLQCTGS